MASYVWVFRYVSVCVCVWGWASVVWKSFGLPHLWQIFSDGLLLCWRSQSALSRTLDGNGDSFNWWHSLTRPGMPAHSSTHTNTQAHTHTSTFPHLCSFDIQLTQSVCLFCCFQTWLTGCRMQNEGWKRRIEKGGGCEEELQHTGCGIRLPSAIC